MDGRAKRLQFAIKRLIDVIGAAAGLCLLTPLLLVVAVLVWRDLGRPILFRQVRPGRGGRPFTMYKFRTMRDACDAHGRPLPDAERLTPLGRFLRRCSLDELPELWNVLRGEMSLVGPRPLLMEYLPRYTSEQARRHDVRPGITGLAQVLGRNAIPFSQRLALDVQYVDRFSLWLDAKILWWTLLRVPGGTLFDGAGQDVRAVDDLGLHPGDESLTWELSRASGGTTRDTTAVTARRKIGDTVGDKPSRTPRADGRDSPTSSVQEASLAQERMRAA
ncbi:MAG: sugar transferase [Thermogutta sp.]